MTNLNIGESDCIILAGGPSLNIHLGKYYKYLNSRIVIGTTPTLLFSIKIDCIVQEHASVEKYNSFDNKTKKHSDLLDRCFNERNGDKDSFSTGNIKISYNSLETRINNQIEKILYSRYKLRNKFNIFKFLFREFRSKELPQYSHSRSPTIICLLNARILKKKKIIVFGFDVFNNGYYFNYSDKYVSSNCISDLGFPLNKNDLMNRGADSVCQLLHIYIRWFKFFFKN